MKKKILYGLLIILLLVIGLLSYIKLALPNVGDPENLKVKITPERIERGEYLAKHVMICNDCHTKRDFSFYSGPYNVQKEGSGGELFDEKMGFPGSIYSKNITPFALKDWSDGEIFRALTCGVNKKGDPLFPLMPYKNYAQLDREDLYSVIAYLRSMKPIKSKMYESSFSFPFNFIIHTIPESSEVKNKIPDRSNSVAYGEYLVKAASCFECHTQNEKGEFFEGMEFAGGYEVVLPNKTVVRSANITPDLETGIGSWTKEDFVRKFKMYADSSYQPVKLKANDFNTIMPWIPYSGMKVEDLEAIYDYLQTVKAVKNKVEKFGSSKSKPE